MTMPDYNLNDNIGWTTTRRIPLCSEAITQLMTLVNTNYQSFVQNLAGIDTANSPSYVQPLNDISNNQNFFNEAASIIIPHNLLNFIEFEYLLNAVSFTEDMITQLFNCLEMTAEFSSFLTALQGMTPENCQNYKNIIQEIMTCPKFLRDAETFLLDT